MDIFEKMAVGVFLPKKVVAFLPQISGHKRVDSINSYSGWAEEESLALGKILGWPAANSSYNEHLQSTEADTTPKLSNLYLIYFIGNCDSNAR